MHPHKARCGLNEVEVLPLDQCLSLLCSRPLGRLAYVAAGSPVVVPVNHTVDGATVVLRTVSGGKLDAALAGEAVAFQIDDHDPARGTGWSMRVQGRAEVVGDPELLARNEDKLDCWAIADSDQMSWLRIVPDEASERRLRRTSVRTTPAFLARDFRLLSKLQDRLLGTSGSML